LRDPDNSIEIEVSVEKAAQEAKERPNDHLTHGKHATALMLEKRYKEAVDALKRAIIALVASKSQHDEETPFQFDLYHSTYLHTMANCQGALGDLDGAIENYEKAIPKHKSPSLVWNDYGVTLNESYRPREALKAFRESVRLGIGHELHWKNLGLTYEKIGRLDEAERVNAVLTGNPSDNEKNLALALLFLDAYEPETAETILEEILDSNPDDVDALVGLIQVSLIIDDGREEELFDKALALNPDHVGALWHRVRNYGWRGKTEEAKPLLEKILELDPEHENARLMLKQINSPDNSFRYKSKVVANIDYTVAFSMLGRIRVVRYMSFFGRTIREVFYRDLPPLLAFTLDPEGARGDKEEHEMLGPFREPGEMVFMLDLRRGSGKREPKIGSFNVASLDDVFFHGDTLSIMKAEDLIGVRRTPLSLMDKFLGIDIVDGKPTRYPITKR
jgi:tetratricopeptide (TPR) repeat protein